MLNQMATLTKGVWFLRDKNKDCGWEGAQQELGTSKETAPGRNVRVEVLPVVFLLLFACLPPTYRWSLGHGLCLQQLAGWSLTRRRASPRKTQRTGKTRSAPGALLAPPLCPSLRIPDPPGGGTASAEHRRGTRRYRGGLRAFHGLLLNAPGRLCPPLPRGGPRPAPHPAQARRRTNCALIT